VLRAGGGTYVLEGEPCFQVVFGGCGVIQRARDDSDDLVLQTEGFVKLLGRADHLLVVVPAVLGGAEHELLNLRVHRSVFEQDEDKEGEVKHCTNLLKLVDSEDSPSIVATS
jgi:hypothetical protein